MEGSQDGGGNTTKLGRKIIMSSIVIFDMDNNYLWTVPYIWAISKWVNILGMEMIWPRT